MPQGQRIRDLDQMLLAVACGTSTETLARQYGMHPRSVYRRINTPAARKRIDELRAEMTTRAAAGLTAAGMEAVKVLVDLLRSGSQTVKLGAARAVLELGMKLREIVHLQTRLDELEHDFESLLGDEKSKTLPRVVRPETIDATENESR